MIVLHVGCSWGIFPSYASCFIMLQFFAGISMIFHVFNNLHHSSPILHNLSCFMICTISREFHVSSNVTTCHDFTSYVISFIMSSQSLIIFRPIPRFRRVPPLSSCVIICHRVFIIFHHIFSNSMVFTMLNHISSLSSFSLILMNFHFLQVLFCVDMAGNAAIPGVLP